MPVAPVFTCAMRLHRTAERSPLHRFVRAVHACREPQLSFQRVIVEALDARSVQASRLLYGDGEMCLIVA